MWGVHGILYPHRLKRVVGHVPHVPHLNAPMGAGGLRGRSTPKILFAPLEICVGHSLKI